MGKDTKQIIQCLFNHVHFFRKTTVAPGTFSLKNEEKFHLGIMPTPQSIFK